MNDENQGRCTLYVTFNVSRCPNSAAVSNHCRNTGVISDGYFTVINFAVVSFKNIEFTVQRSVALRLYVQDVVQIHNFLKRLVFGI